MSTTTSPSSVPAPAPWPLDAWYHAAWSDEVADKPLGRTLLDQPVVLFRDAGGAARALADRCAHRATPLRLGEVTPAGLQCGYHGVTFDGSGRCTLIPGQDAIPEAMCVRSYPILERQQILWIWMGDPKRADEALLAVDFPWLDDQVNWPHVYDVYEIEAGYELLVDNLMDLTHLPFIHRATIGGGNQKGQIEATMEVTPTEHGVHYIRWMEAITPPPTYVKGAGFADGILVDRWQEFEYVAPSTVLQWTGALPVGQGAKENRVQPGGFNLRLYHGATPRTATSCYYFWTPLNGYNPTDAEATKLLHNEIAFTFDEDVAFLEAQQAEVSTRPDVALVNIRHDRARVHASRALTSMIERERPRSPTG